MCGHVYGHACMHACSHMEKIEADKASGKGTETKLECGGGTLAQPSAKILPSYLFLFDSIALADFLSPPPTDVRQVIDPTCGDYFTR